jgi:YVTN family beta-propeller protein
MELRGRSRLIFSTLVMLMLLASGFLASALTFVKSVSAQTDTKGVTNVPVGPYPTGIAYDAINGQLYVAETGTDQVSVINGSTNTLVGKVTVGAAPIGIAFDSANGDIYVADLYSGTVSVINGSTNAVIATVLVGGGPDAVAFDSSNGNVYVVNTRSFTVSVISDSTNTVVANVAVGSWPVGVAFDPANGDIYVANTGPALGSPGNVSVISGSNNSVIATVRVGDDPVAIAFDSANGDLYVTTDDSNSVSVISGSTNKLVRIVPEDSGPIGVGYDPADEDIYVANFFYGTVSVISGATNMVFATVHIGGTLGSGYAPFGVAFDPANGDVYVANQDLMAVSVIPPFTTLTASCSPASIVVGSATICEATVKESGYTPTGTVTWTQGGTGSVSFITKKCTLSESSCSVTLTGAKSGFATITAAYPGGPNNLGSSGTAKLIISVASTATAISCSKSTFPSGSSITCTANVTGLHSTHTGIITWTSVSGPGRVTFFPKTTCTLIAGKCSVTLKGMAAGSVTIEATYSGNTYNQGSSGKLVLKIA